jgi:uncharacterized protein (TIGR04255 family)
MGYDRVGRIFWRCGLSRQIYAKPPITEAVLSIVFADPIDDNTLSKTRDKLQKNYQNVRQLMRIDADFDGQRAVVRNVPIGYQLSDHDQLNHCILKPNEVATSVLAPYPGWEAFVERMTANFAVARETMGYRKIARISGRYINRLDIPFTDGPIETLDYITIGPAPRTDFLHKTRLYGLRTETDSPGGLRVIVSTGIADPALVAHMSIVLDIDVIQLAPPQRPEEVLETLEQIHGAKNEVFELCITDNARELFK